MEELIIVHNAINVKIEWIIIAHGHLIVLHKEIIKAFFFIICIYQLVLLKTNIMHIIIIKFYNKKDNMIH